MRKIRRVIVHHSASSLDTTLEQIRSWHLERGFSDIGYHWVVERGGLLRPGRPWEKIGAHVKGANRDSLGICLVGDNTEPGQEWTREQIQTLERWLRAVQIFFPEIEFYGHRDVRATQCPGLEVRALVGVA